MDTKASELTVSASGTQNGYDITLVQRLLQHSSATINGADGAWDGVGNECCWYGCYDRKKCYENVSRKNLGENCEDHIYVSPDAYKGYRFSDAMKNPGFIGVEDIQKVYVPQGFSNFKIEGRSLGRAVILEFLLYYLTKPEYQLKVREETYLDSMLDLF